jgi:ubiquinone biosynthesis monooxygenase Coq7
MKGHEMVHLQNLQAIMPEKRIRPTALLPFWHVAGYALGAGTALLGERAAMACTVAVEEVITDHYNSQLRALHEREDMKSEESLRQVC